MINDAVAGVDSGCHENIWNLSTKILFFTAVEQSSQRTCSKLNCADPFVFSPAGGQRSRLLQEFSLSVKGRSAGCWVHLMCLCRSKCQRAPPKPCWRSFYRTPATPSLWCRSTQRETDPACPTPGRQVSACGWRFYWLTLKSTKRSFNRSIP